MLGVLALQRQFRPTRIVELATALVPLVIVWLVMPSNASATNFGSDWPVYHQNGLSSGVDPSGTILTSIVADWTSAPMDGQIYGEPLVENGEVIAATENNTVYALSTSTGAILWQTHIASPVPSSNLPCGNIAPTVGITSSPVIDPNLSEVFVVDDESTSGTGAAHNLVGLDLSGGAILLDTPADPPGSHPLYQLQRPASPSTTDR
jgi:outer membrane protein assembly factor BamB